MPECLKRALRGLTAAERSEVWDWVDGDPDVIEKLISVLADTRADELQDEHAKRLKR